MGTARLVNRTAKTASPLRIMHTDTIIERHPVINRRPVIFTLQDRIFLLICQRIRACRGSPAFRQVSRYEIRLYHQLSFFIEEKVLSGQVDLHVSVAVVICPMLAAFWEYSGSRVVLSPEAIIAASASVSAAWLIFQP